MGLAPIEYFDTFEEAQLALPRLKKEWVEIELIILKETNGYYSICVD